MSLQPAIMMLDWFQRLLAHERTLELEKQGKLLMEAERRANLPKKEAEQLAAKTARKKPKLKTKKRKVRFPEIGADAKKKLTEDRILLKEKGYTLVSAAELLGVHHVHLMRVLNGERISKRLTDAARELPKLNKEGASK